MLLLQREAIEDEPILALFRVDIFQLFAKEYQNESSCLSLSHAHDKHNKSYWLSSIYCGKQR
jgi:hypothetical protein